MSVEKVRAYIAEQEQAGSIQRGSDGWRTRLPKFPQLSFDSSQTCRWNLKTSHGDVTVRFLTAEAPDHVANFVYLTELGFFDGLAFHRVITGFMAQGGCPEGSGRGNPGYRFGGETDNGVKHDRPGLLSMANAGPDTDGSQFFLTFVETPWLDGKHAVFGVVEEGLETLKELEKRGSRSGTTSEPLSIEKATVSVS